MTTLETQQLSRPAYVVSLSDLFGTHLNIIWHVDLPEGHLVAAARDDSPAMARSPTRSIASFREASVSLANRP